MDPRPTINVLLFKRDLRLRDHAALEAAIEAGRPLLLIYCFEPSVVASPHHDVRHWRFVHECLAEIDRDLQGSSSCGIFVFCREVVDVFEALLQHFEIETLYSHEETGVRVTYDRDKALSKICKREGIAWREFQTNGVVRPLRDRETWTADWKATMAEPQRHPELARLLPVALPDGWFERERGPELPAEWRRTDEAFQPGGESVAHELLESFFDSRIRRYMESISSPTDSRTGCSRLSPYLAWGSLSVRQVCQAEAKADLKGVGIGAREFMGRLRARCWFVQAFEGEDRMEFENVSRLSDAVERKADPEAFAAWREGRTGYPLVDACMRCLIATGYVNFRMRSMLISFVSHLLLQPWQETAWHLARVFTDFEPGIHYGQVQMQSGTSGMNAVRIYNPIKQSQEHDPTGEFIRRWVPELAECPLDRLHEPWTMPPMEQAMCGFQVDVDYPAPIVDYIVAFREARLRINEPRMSDAGQEERARIKQSRPSIPRADDVPSRRFGRAKPRMGRGAS